MNKEAELLQLKGEKVQIQQYLNHPVTKQVERDNTSEQEAVLVTILEMPVFNIESLVKHFEALGHLRGLKRAKAITQDALEEVEEKMKELNNER